MDFWSSDEQEGEPPEETASLNDCADSGGVSAGKRSYSFEDETGAWLADGWMAHGLERARQPVQRFVPKTESKKVPTSKRRRKDKLAASVASALAPLVGRRVRVWWPAERSWFCGVVSHYSHELGHSITYDDGDLKRHLLHTEGGWKWNYIVDELAAADENAKKSRQVKSSHVSSRQVKTSRVEARRGEHDELGVEQAGDAADELFDIDSMIQVDERAEAKAKAQAIAQAHTKSRGEAKAKMSGVSRTMSDVHPSFGGGAASLVERESQREGQREGQREVEREGQREGGGGNGAGMCGNGTGMWGNGADGEVCDMATMRAVLDRLKLSQYAEALDDLGCVIKSVSHKSVSK